YHCTLLRVARIPHWVNARPRESIGSQYRITVSGHSIGSTSRKEKMREMTKALLVLLIFAAGFLTATCIQRSPPAAVAQDAPSCTKKSGDVDGDDQLQLNDAVYILSYLFLGSKPLPLPFCSTPECPPCPPGLLPASAQEKCYDEDGQEIPCDSAGSPGQDAFFKSGCSNEDRVVDNGDGTASDKCTGLMW